VAVALARGRAQVPARGLAAAAAAAAGRLAPAEPPPGNRVRVEAQPASWETEAWEAAVRLLSVWEAAGALSLPARVNKHRSTYLDLAPVSPFSHTQPGHVYME
jgi:hypothetical protein